MKSYWVYIVSNLASNVLYIGFTNDLERRVLEHKAMLGASFPSKFKCTQLLFFEEHTEVSDAIAREKSLKKWKRDWKNNLTREMNPYFEDLAKDWFDTETILMLNKLGKQ